MTNNYSYRISHEIFNYFSMKTIFTDIMTMENDFHGMIIVNVNHFHGIIFMENY